MLLASSRARRDPLGHHCILRARLRQRLPVASKTCQLDPGRHTPMMLGLWSIDEEAWTVVLSPQLRGTDYESLHSKAVQLPKGTGDRPSQKSQPLIDERVRGNEEVKTREQRGLLQRPCHGVTRQFSSGLGAMTSNNQKVGECGHNGSFPLGVQLRAAPLGASN